MWVVLCTRCGPVCYGHSFTHSLTHSYMPDDIVGRALYSALPTTKRLGFLSGSLVFAGVPIGATRVTTTFKDDASFCHCAHGLRTSGWSSPPPPPKRYFCTVYTCNHAGKTGLSKGYWNPKIKLGVATHFSGIIKLQFGKNAYIVLRQSINASHSDTNPRPGQYLTHAHNHITRQEKPWTC